MTTWLVLAASLPAQPSGLRVRIWRSLKSTGCATLRDGVYLLPESAPTAAGLWQIEAAIRAGGAEAHLLVTTARDAAQEANFRARFDRKPQYAEFAQALKQAGKAVHTGAEPALRKHLRGLEQQLQAVRSIDFFAGAAADQARAGLDALRARIEKRLSPGEPPDAGAQALGRLEAADFQGRTWATRRRPWVDRLATAWLVVRFIDESARFVWLKDAGKCPKSALGFDFEGARFSHGGGLVTYEVVARSFGVDADPAIRRLGDLVHSIDVGGAAVVEEAAGIESIVRGLQAQHAGDEALRIASLPLFDALLASMRASP